MPNLQSTYKDLIAQAILQELGVNMSVAEIHQHFSEPKNFYRLLVRVEAQVTQIQLLMNQTLDMQNYVQTRLSSLVFADFSLRAQEGQADPAEASESLSGKMLANMQNKFEGDAATINRYKEEVALAKNEIHQLTRDLLASWKKLTASHGNYERFYEECSAKIQGKIELYVEKRKQYIDLLQETFKASESIEMYLGKFSSPALFRAIQANSAEVSKPAIAEPEIAKREINPTYSGG